MPAVRRRRPEPDVPDEDEPTPRRRSRPDPEEEPPARSRRSHPEADEDYEDAPRRRPRRRSTEDDEDDSAGRRRGSSRAPAGGAGRRPRGRVATGWGGYSKVKAASGDFEKKFKPSKDGEVIALLEPEPFAAFARHWVDLEGGKRAFICPASLDVDADEDPLECPLCDVGDKPNGPKAYINVAVLKPGGRPELNVWEIGGSVSDQLQTINKSIGRKTDLTDIYLLASSTGSGLSTKYHLEPLFDEDLGEFEVEPLTEKQLAAFELYDASLYDLPSLTELNRVADEIA